MYPVAAETPLASTHNHCNPYLCPRRPSCLADGDAFSLPRAVCLGVEVSGHQEHCSWRLQAPALPPAPAAKAGAGWQHSRHLRCSFLIQMLVLPLLCQFVAFFLPTSTLLGCSEFLHAPTVFCNCLPAARVQAISRIIFTTVIPLPLMKIC